MRWTGVYYGSGPRTGSDGALKGAVVGELSQYHVEMKVCRPGADDLLVGLYSTETVNAITATNDEIMKVRQHINYV